MKNSLKIILPLCPMLKMKSYLYIITSLLLFVGQNINAQKTDLTAKEVINKMLKSINDVERFKYNLKIFRL